MSHPVPAEGRPQTYDRVSRALHWSTALLILVAIPLGLVANRLPFDTSEALALKAQVFSLHKTLGIAAFGVGVVRILWALGRRHPGPLHPDRPVETALAAVVHWLLYVSLVAVPLTGWVHHAATTGFAPILWPFGQGLPFVPQSSTVEAGAATLHGLFTKLLVLSVLLHVAGALQHHLIDRDATLLRMWSGARAAAPVPPRPRRWRLAAPVVAFGLFATLAGAGLIASRGGEATAALSPAPEALSASSGQAGWTVEAGTLGLTVRQLGSPVTGRFDRWQADIDFDPEASGAAMGRVTVDVTLDSVTLGSVTDQVKGSAFFDVATHPTARFSAAIRRAPDGAARAYVADGTLRLRGVEVPVQLAFDLDLEGDIAQVTGQTLLDRRDFGLGADYPDDATVGFQVSVDVTLTARRRPDGQGAGPEDAGRGALPPAPPGIFAD